METEKFDESIRKKLDKINNESLDRSSEVDAIYRHILKKRNLRSKKNTMVFLGSMLLIVGGLYTWNVLQGKEIRELEQKVAHLKNAFQAQHRSVISGKNTTSAYFQAKRTNPVLVAAKAQTASFNSPTQLKATQENSDSSLSRGKEISVLMSPKELKPDLENSPTSEIHSNPTPITDSIYSSQKFVQVEEPVSALVPIGGNEGKLMEQDSVITKASAREPSGGIMDSTVNGPATELSAIKNWQYGVGASFEIGRLQIGGALLAEALFKKKWVISFGIKLLENGTQNFDDDDDYHDKNKNQFHNVYSGHVSDGSNKNIAIKNTILQVPLNVNYRFSIKRNFAILAGLGTDVDLYIRQDVDYKHANSSADYKSMKFATNYPPVYLNNVVLSTGLQKTVHHFTIELSPYLSPQIKTVSYKKENLYYGLRLRTFFVF